MSAPDRVHGSIATIRNCQSAANAPCLDWRCPGFYRHLGWSPILLSKTCQNSQSGPDYPRRIRALRWAVEVF